MTTLESVDACVCRRRARHDFPRADNRSGPRRMPRDPVCAHDSTQRPRHGAAMKLGAITVSIVSSIVLATLAFADASPTSNKWRIELSGQALTTGELVFRVTPRQGEATDISVNIRSGREENNVAKDVRDAFAAKLSPERFSVEVDDGEDILVKKKEGQPDFALELVQANVQNVSIKVEGE
jgi:hypothetical protein